MGIGDFVDKGKDLVSGNSEKAKDGIDKGADAAKDAVEGLDGDK
jgi:hypothetical protein